MSRNSPLEDLLQSQVQEGQQDSSGHFTLAREAALKKLAEFQSSSPRAWALKLVQAVVAAQARELKVRQTPLDTVFRFIPQIVWNLEEVEEAFYNPEVSENSGLDHLKRGLWSVAVHETRPFLMMLPGWSRSLYWNGQSLLRQSPVAQASGYLAVSHRNLAQDKGFHLFRDVETASKNVAISEELAARAFTCPIPFTLDGRRQDALQACPEHGCSKSSYPIYLGFLDSELPELKIPPATFKGYVPQAKGNFELTKIFHTKVSIPEHIGVACLITAHLRELVDNSSRTWETYTCASTVYWVNDGVVIDRLRLPWEEASVSCALFVSAQGLSTDLSGFKLIRNEDYYQRIDIAVQSLGPFLEKAEVSLGDYIARQKTIGRTVGEILLLAAGGVMFMSLVGAFAIGAVGLYNILSGGGEGEWLEAGLRCDLAELRKQACALNRSKKFQ